MFAIFRSGGKQYRVEKASVVDVEHLDVAVGDTVTINDVLCLSDAKPIFGTPNVPGAAITAKVVEQGKSDKILVFKKRRRKNSRRLNGHRQTYTRLEILDIVAKTGN